QAARLLLSARRAAAMVLFEVKRRDAARTAEAQAAIYRGLLQRATFAVLTDEDAGRWALEADAWIRSAPLLEGAVLEAQLHRALGLAALDPAALAALAEERLAYQAPDPAPPAPKPDYKYMQPDKRRRRRHKKK